MEECLRAVRRAAATLTFVVLLSPAPAAVAQQPGRCYPPPCATEAPAPAVPTDSAVAPGRPSPSSPRVDELRSPAPFVATGLFAVLGSLSLVTLRRRSHILRRSGGPLLAPTPASLAGPVSPEPQAALR